MATTPGGGWPPPMLQPCLDRSSPNVLNSLRLDTARNAYLLQTTESRDTTAFRGNVLYAIRYSADSRCPIILDSVRGSRSSAAFEYECTVAGHKGEAAVALVRFDKNENRLGILKTWLIEPRSLHFVPVSGKTTCSHEGYAGADTGGDLLSRARER
jgi:hypothetical protein